MIELFNNGKELDKVHIAEHRKKPLMELLKKYASLEDVTAIAIGGSSASASTDSTSDIDIYIFEKKVTPADTREQSIVKPCSDNYEVGGDYFGPGDEFMHNEMGQECDVMYWTMDWFEDIVKSTWINHQGQNGYTTAFLYTLKNFSIIYDSGNWLSSLRNMVQKEYPLELRDNIVTRNLMLMKDKPFSSYFDQICKAAMRNDMVSINHRICAFMASYFDVLFAINRIFHPGEKRLVSFALNNCPVLPAMFKENFDELFNCGTTTQRRIELLETMFNAIKDTWHTIRSQEKIKQNSGRFSDFN